MAFVTEENGYAVRQSRRKGFPLRLGGFARMAVLTTTGLVTCGWMMTALGMLATVMPSSASRPVSATMPQSLAIVDQNQAPWRKIRQEFIVAHTADSVYSNLDWHRSEAADDAPIIADIGPDSVIEPKPVDMASLVELRADRARRPEPVVVAVAKKADAPQTLLAYAAMPQTPSAVLALARIQPQNSSAIMPLSQAEEADVLDQAEGDLLLPDDVPLPGAKPALRSSRMRARTELAYAPESGLTDSETPELSSPLLNHAARNRTAIYDISAATVYLPSGERLEAHSGLGHMRDNPTYVTQKNRGPTPPHTYDLRMREALFHGVEAIRLTPSDGKNRYNRDGLLAHTYMLGRRGDSNGCVVFPEYTRFLRAFKRGEFNKLVVVTRMPSSMPARVASLF